MHRKLAEGRPPKRLVQFGQVSGDGRVDIDLPLFREEHQGEAGELLGDRRDPDARLRRVGDSVLYAGETEPAPI